MTRCSWCNRILWPFQAQSEGRTLHFRCSSYVDRITGETQEQYTGVYFGTLPADANDTGWSSEEQLRQAQMRWREEDRL